jgi:hypothetical protein
MHPHEKQLSENNIAVTDLSEKTQKKIAKFAAETDEDKRDSLDESIFGDVEDFIDDKKAKEKADAKKASHAAAKADSKKKVDVSGAPTAQDAATKAATEKAAADAAGAKKKERTPLATIFGRSSE